MKPQIYLGAYYKDAFGKWRYAFNGELVPGAYDLPSSTSVEDVAMGAPELLITQLLDIGLLSKVLEVSVNTIYSMKYQGRLPTPQYDNGKTVMWAVPVIEYWQSQRPKAKLRLAKRTRHDDKRIAG